MEAGSKHQFVTLCEALYQFYRAANRIWFMDNDGILDSSVNPGNLGIAWDVAGL
ncbi:MAG: hypothetical protein F6K54_15810 [Okeania sp. SIO3B5]|uniref:hypothetical protein n=1 Tax=Okeania sp. SIO3B5 TaxID=2607811 RepID=UPI001400598D|nr:hypothetical protein [Okeania sp. SIO3B5]NEO54420.1 hypothetical protein [Okeania sp. SIO3B5]